MQVSDDQDRSASMQTAYPIRKNYDEKEYVGAVQWDQRTQYGLVGYKGWLDT